MKAHFLPPEVVERFLKISAVLPGGCGRGCYTAVTLLNPTCQIDQSISKLDAVELCRADPPVVPSSQVTWKLWFEV